MTSLETFLQSCRERVEKAVPHPWVMERVDHDNEITFEIKGNEGFFAKIYESDFEDYKRNAKPTCELIAHAPTDLTKLLELVAVMREALESTSKNSCCDTCQQAKLVALSALQRADEIAGRET